MPQILNKRLLYRASKEREQANLFYKKGERIIPINIVVIGFGIVFSLTTYFAIAACILFLAAVLAFVSGSFMRSGDIHWNRSRNLVRQARQQTQAQIKATRGGLGAGEKPAQEGQALVPLFNTTPGGSTSGTR